MRLTVVCVGRLSREYRGVADHYVRLLTPYATIEVREVPEVPISHGSTRVLSAEGDQLMRQLRPGAYTVVLDREGREFTSEALSARLAAEKLYGRSDFQFILGGALGLEENVLGAADLVWSLSRLTFPHQLARCVLLEQLYRALRIERGEPYHH